jgi:two-component system cell cycle response regulator
MTTSAAPMADSGIADALGLAEVLTELESRSMSQFRSVSEPAGAAEFRALELGDPELLHRAMLLRGSVLLREGRSAEAGVLAHQVLDWAELHHTPNLLARTHRELAIFYRQIGDLADALRHAVQGVAHLSDDTAPVLRARHLLSLAVALDENGSAEESHRRFREALGLATGIGDYDLTLNILNNVAYIAYENDDEPGARALVTRMRDAQSHSGRAFTANELDTLARIEMMSSNHGAVEDILGPALQEHSTVLGDEGDAFAECLLTLAEARRLDGRHAACQQALDAAVRMCEERGLETHRARAHEEQAALYAAAGRYREAYEQHRLFHAAFTALRSTQREARAHVLHAVFQAAEARKDGERFREMAYRDALTGLHNRRYVNETVPAILGAARMSRSPVSLAILDLDHFKRINDTLSHNTGDAVLKQVGAILAEAAEDGTFVAARMGGEEFLLVLPDVDAAEAFTRCEQLRCRIRAHDWGPVTGDLRVTTSVGLTTSHLGDGTMQDLLARADDQLYAAKRGGRDRVESGS